MSDATPPPATAAAPSAKEDTTVAILAYITIIGFIIAIVMHNGKKTALGAYHLRQVLGLIVTGIACWPINFILAFIPFLGWAAMIGIFFGLIALWVMGLIAAIKGEQKPMPVLGEKYQQWFGNAFN